MKNTTKNIMVTSLMAMFAVIPLAQANHDDYARNTSDFDNFVVNAKVVSVTPIFKYVTTNTPIEHCYRNRVINTDYHDGNRSGRMLLGGLIGGVIGNNIGHGGGRKARAVVGALIGSQIGSRIADKHAYTEQHAGYQQRCNTQNVSETRKQVDGYNVSYKFRGRMFTTIMPYNPGHRIKLSVNVSPVIDD